MNINQLSDREAMGLANYYIPTVKDNIQSIYNKYRKMDENDLLNIIENKDYDLLTRYAVGHILAMTGDSRISALNPVMIDVPSAEVEIGIDESDVLKVLENFPGIGLEKDWILKETPKFSTTVSEFRIGKYLITNYEFKEFLIQTQFDEFPTSWEFGIYPENRSNHPVYTVSITAADAYIKWISKKTGRKFRLATEYEWEYAASSIKHFEFPWGEKYKDNYSNTLESKFFSSTPVGIFVEGFSAFGVADMSGNVEEYVSDDFAPYVGSKFVSDDITNKLGNYKVCRGGSFTRHADLARCTRRHGAYPKNIYVIGFRLAESI